MIRHTVLVIVTSVIALAAPVVPSVMAQPTTATPTGVSEILKQLNLTADQQRRVDEIQALAAVQIKGTLTPDQLAQLKVFAEQGRGDAEAFNALNLTEPQKTRLNEIKMDVAMQLLPVLTSEQQQKLFEAVTARSKTP